MAKIDDNSYTVFFNARHKSNANDSSEILMDNMVIREKKSKCDYIYLYFFSNENKFFDARAGEVSKIHIGCFIIRKFVSMMRRRTVKRWKKIVYIVFDLLFELWPFLYCNNTQLPPCTRKRWNRPSLIRNKSLRSSYSISHFFKIYRYSIYNESRKSLVKIFKISWTFISEMDLTYSVYIIH